MKTYKYSTKERAERVAKTLGCSGSHSHGSGKDKKYMPCKDMKTFKEKTKNKKNTKEEEVTELVDYDGTWLSSDIPIIDPQSSLKGSTITDKIVPMSRNPRDPLLRGWYGYFGEDTVKEEDMSDAFGYEDTKDLDYKDTVKHYEKELKLDPEDAIDRANQQGKDKKYIKKTPKKIKDLKNFIDTLLLKELEDDISEDIIFNKNSDDDKTELKSKVKEIHPLLLKNLRALKSMAKKLDVPLHELMKALKDE